MPASRAPVGTGFQPIAAFLREQQALGRDDNPQQGVLLLQFRRPQKIVISRR